MEEETRQAGDKSVQSGSDNVEYSVTVQGKHLGEKVSLPPGATLADLLGEVEKKYGIQTSKYGIRLNDRQIDVQDGKLRENPVLTENGVLILLEKIVGGEPIR